MVLLSSPVCDFGKALPNFRLRNIDSKFYNREMIVGKNGTLVFFICNHCPYVKAIIKKLVFTVGELKKSGIESVGIMPNDVIKYPEDSFDMMRVFSLKHGFNFPYLLDEEQNVAKDFGAICTPDFFGYNKNNELQYRGRLAELKNLEYVNSKNDLLEAMQKIAQTNKGPSSQHPSAGCSIKWRLC